MGLILTRTYSISKRDSATTRLCLEKNLIWLKKNRPAIIAWIRMMLIMQHWVRNSYSYCDEADIFRIKVLWIDVTIAWCEAWLEVYQGQVMSCSLKPSIYQVQEMIQNLVTNLREHNSYLWCHARSIDAALKEVNSCARWPNGLTPHVPPHGETLDVNQSIEDVFNQGKRQRSAHTKSNEAEIKKMKQKLQEKMETEFGETLQKAKEDARKASEEKMQTNDRM
jgi:hypothetical protein